MAQMNMIQALNSAMDVMIGRDPSVVVMGEDVGYFGGVFRVTDGLQTKVRRTPGARLAHRRRRHRRDGHRHGGERIEPVAEIQFADYIYPAFDQIASELARIRYRTAGDFPSPVAVRAPAAVASAEGRRTRRAPKPSSRTSAASKW